MLVVDEGQHHLGGYTDRASTGHYGDMTTESVEVETTHDDRMDPRTLHRVRDLLLERCGTDPAPLSRDEIESCAGSSLFVVGLLAQLLDQLDQPQRAVPKTYDETDRSAQDQHLSEAINHLREASGHLSSWHRSMRRAPSSAR